MHAKEPDIDLVNFSQAAENNRLPILGQLEKHLTSGQTVLEIGSGSGQHAINFANALPYIKWQPTDQGDYYPGLEQNISAYGPDNVMHPRYLDLSSPDWPDNCDCLYSANVIHIMPEALLAQMFQSPSNLILLYGPYKYDGEFTSDSNARFDLWLKDRNPLSGIRDIEVLKQLAEQQKYQLISDTPMPANNQFLVLKRET